MSERKIRAIVYCPKTEKAEEVMLGGLDDYYKHLQCRTFDVVSAERFDIYVDDEGMMVSGNLVTQIDGIPVPLAGRLLFTGGVDGRGETLSLDDSVREVDIEDICSPYGYVG